MTNTHKSIVGDHANDRTGDGNMPSPTTLISYVSFCMLNHEVQALKFTSLWSSYYLGPVHDDVLSLLTATHQKDRQTANLWRKAVNSKPGQTDKLARPVNWSELAIPLHKMNWLAFLSGNGPVETTVDSEPAQLGGYKMSETEGSTFPDVADAPLTRVGGHSRNEPINQGVPKGTIIAWAWLTTFYIAIAEAAKSQFCRNMIIHGNCKFEGKGCAFRHDRVSIKFSMILNISKPGYGASATTPEK